MNSLGKCGRTYYRQQFPTCTLRRLVIKLRAVHMLHFFIAMAFIGERKTRVAAEGMDLNIDSAPCVRLFHSGGDVGCRSLTREGIVGPLLAVETMSDIEDIDVLATQNSGAVGDDGLVVVMPTGLLNSAALDRLLETNLLAGVLVVDCCEDEIDVDHRMEVSAATRGYSPAVVTPQVCQLMSY